MSTNEHNTQAIITEIERFAVHDGPGIRTLAFLKGCPLYCWVGGDGRGLETEGGRMELRQNLFWVICSVSISCPTTISDYGFRVFYNPGTDA